MKVVKKITDVYFEIQEKYENLYGEKTLLLMEVGSFFEIYGISNNIEKVGPNLKTICDLLNIQMTRKNTSNPNNDRGNPYMAGFPNYVVQKFVRILLHNNYTIVIMEQDKHGVSKPTRKVTKIYSPGTNIENVSDTSSTLVSIYVDEFKDVSLKKSYVVCGFSSINVITGKSYVNEFSSKENDKLYPISQIMSIIYTEQPSEIILSFNETVTETVKIKLISYCKEFLSSTHVNNKVENKFKNISFQDRFLSSIFENKTSIPTIEYLCISKFPFSIISYVQLLHFTYEHNNSLVKKLKKPEILKDSENTTLHDTTLYQLNVINSNKRDCCSSLWDIINKCKTASGKRLLKYRLLHPIYSITELQKRYDKVDSVLCKSATEPSKYLFELFQTKLDNIIDLERYHRKMCLSILQPMEMFTLYDSYISILDLVDISIKNKNVINLHEETLKKFNFYVKHINSIFNIPVLCKCKFDNIPESFFKEGLYPEIDKLQNRIYLIEQQMEYIRKQLSDKIDANKDCIKLCSNEREGYFLSLTKTRFKKLSSELKLGKPLTISIDEFTNVVLNMETFHTIKTTNSIKLKHSLFNSNYRDICNYRNSLQETCIEKYKNILEELYETYSSNLNEIVTKISKIDVICSSAEVSITNNYSKPVLHKSTSNGNWVDCIELRHPIIEKLHTKIEYIPNDIYLGPTPIDKKETNGGILLYGINASGKSSLMKSVALSLIMAQSGMFVPAKSMNFTPFHHIFTRLSKNDNIFQGFSSFAVEMNELRNILYRADNHSIVFGDEICSGTESQSAVAIVGSSILHLHRNKIPFLFATHLHELPDIKDIHELKTVHSYHLGIRVNENTNKIEYNRKLKKGKCESLYGIEVCRSMNMPIDFIKNAQRIRHDILGTQSIVSSRYKVSSYNTAKFITSCEVCSENAVDVHHIKFQCSADENNMIGSIHKNTESNLVSLCKKCHNQVHNGDLVINGYVETSEGIELSFKYIENQKEKKGRRKFRKEHIEWIMSLDKNISRKNLKILFQNKFKSSISMNTISKILNNNYVE